MKILSCSTNYDLLRNQDHEFFQYTDEMTSFKSKTEVVCYK